MKNRWNENASRQALRRWDSEGPEMALRLYSARLIGEEPGLVLHGGGNVSLKTSQQDVRGETIETLRIKGSGHDLADIDPLGLPALDLAALLTLRDVESLDDASMVNELRRRLLDANAPTPSIETLVHAFLPQRYVDHSHPDALLVLTNQPDGRERVLQLLGESYPVLPYIFPGFDLAREVSEAHRSHPEAQGLVLMHHGLITMGETAQESYERHLDVVSQCEKEGARFSIQLGAPSTKTEQARERLRRVAPWMRGLLARPSRDPDRAIETSILEWRGDEEILGLIEHPRWEAVSGSGPLTTDHLIRTKTHPLMVRLDFDAEDTWKETLEKAIDTYSDDYLRYMKAYPVEGFERIEETLDPAPRVVIVPGVGVLSFGPTKKEARVTSDITAQALRAKLHADAIGRYQALSEEHLHAMEFRPMQLAKLGGAGRPLEGRVVMISGAAGAIGAGIAQTCARAGAHVVVGDLDAERLGLVVERIENECGPGTAMAQVMDVTDEQSVIDGFDRAIEAYGGLDVIVPNAGIAHVSPVDSLDVGDFRRVLEVNLVGYMLFMREGARRLIQQGLGGHIIINSSKNVFGPGKDFGAYSASKAGGHQLGKVSAIELAEHGIRVNMINADAVFGDEEIPSGLWAEVGPERARRRGLETKELPEYYRNRNLLKTRVFAHHVGNAVVFFASNATPTTGATLPVDGGVTDAFPR